MKIITYNINSIRARMDNLLAVLSAHAPDIVCLQEIKCEAADFPMLELQAAGYTPYIAGQKSYNGVAVLSKRPLTLRHTALPDAPDDQARYLEVETEHGMRIINVYVPNGNPMGTDKYTYKTAWLAALRARIDTLNTKRAPLIICGDFNIIPNDADCYDPAAWRGDALFQPAVREWYRALLHAGFTDALATLHTPAPCTFWDYQGGAWQLGHGIRIDHFVLNPEAADRLQSCTVDKSARAADKASDHAPVALELRAEV